MSWSLLFRVACFLILVVAAIATRDWGEWILAGIALSLIAPKRSSVLRGRRRRA